MRVWGTRFCFIFLVVFGRLTFAKPATSSVPDYCSTSSVTDWILGFRETVCDANNYNESTDTVTVIEGGEVSLRKALDMVHSRSHGYVAVLFYASWCPFCRTFRPTFSVLASLYPSIPHLTIEKSAIRPSVLSEYGVHGFPALFLINSTMRARYGGSRKTTSLRTFYRSVTGIRADPLHQVYLNKTECASNHKKSDHIEQESCPFSWARSPENLLHEETYLALATAFVLLRMLYLVFPYLLEFSRFAWRRRMQTGRLRRLWEQPLAYVNRAAHLINWLNGPRKRSNLHEGAMNARTWASKSIASAVVIGDASTSREDLHGDVGSSVDYCHLRGCLFVIDTDCCIRICNINWLLVSWLKPQYKNKVALQLVLQAQNYFLQFPSALGLLWTFPVFCYEILNSL
ncbi:hypothetical protein Nepgr_001996 [Nepenthes gracilis]|uniref:Thioredoxin domain-containing protein n=1 Tax=Nepenthes gracilis TaxID=150966 RepID=A0AAD3P9F7_NEPGR|nr:hypothetical protein Nepgr_001996 [Nepenthes gracilis]